MRASLPDKGKADILLSGDHLHRATSVFSVMLQYERVTRPSVEIAARSQPTMQTLAMR